MIFPISHSDPRRPARGRRPQGRLLALRVPEGKLRRLVSQELQGKITVILTRKSLNIYRVSYPIIHRFFGYVIGSSPAFGALLQLATAQAGQGELPNKT